MNKLLLHQEPLQEHSQKPKDRHQVKSELENQKISKEISGVALYSAKTEELPVDFQLCRTLKPLLELQTVQEKNVSNPYLIRGVPMVTNFVWKFLEKGSRVDIRWAELEHTSLCKIMSYCSDRVLIYVHPSFYKSLKLWSLPDVIGWPSNY